VGGWRFLAQAMTDRKKQKNSPRTPEAEATILAELRKGKPEYVAAAVAGVWESSFRYWKRTDENFANEVARARLVGCSVLHDRAATGDDPGQGFGPAKVALELLARRYPKHYSQKIQISMEYEIDRILDVVQGICSPEDFERVLTGIAALDSQEETPEPPGSETRIH
jgi:hypothetical protein